MSQQDNARIATTWVLAIGGWLLSYLLFFRWLAENSWDFLGGWATAFAASDFSVGFHTDLVFVSFMLIALAIFDRRRLGAKWTAAVLLSLALSASMSLACYLVGSWRHQRSDGPDH